MIAQNFLELFERDILKVQDELRLYEKDADIWKTTATVKNSAGTLALHLTGNLKHFIGAVLGKSGYVRQRDMEFSQRGLSRETIILGLSEALVVVRSTLPRLTDADFTKEFPVTFPIQPDIKKTTLEAMLIILTHLSYHLGQINYHRRLPFVSLKDDMAGHHAL
jgi:hypothetical protein